MIVVDAIDLAGATAALDLARATSALIVHAEPDDLEALQNQGYFTTSPSEAALRGDRIVVLGGISEVAASDEAFRRIIAKPGIETILHLDTGGVQLASCTTHQIQRIELTTTELIDTLGTATATASGTLAVSDTPAARHARLLTSFAEGTAYGIMCHETGHLDRHALLAAMALANELASTTRWSLLPIGRRAGQSELIRMAQASTGLPPPLDFRVCRPRHDHVTIDPQQRIADGDVDQVIWISASKTTPPAWVRAAAALITIDASGQIDGTNHIHVGVAGVDFPALIDPAEMSGTIALQPSDGPTSTPTMATVLETLTQQIRAALPADHPSHINDNASAATQ